MSGMRTRPQRVVAQDVFPERKQRAGWSVEPEKDGFREKVRPE